MTCPKEHQLHLNLKGEYFDDIKAGNKPFEYRLKNDYWSKRLIDRRYDIVYFKSGYPRSDELDKIIAVPYRGYEIQTITHKHFGDEPVEVFAIHTNSLSTHKKDLENIKIGVPYKNKSLPEHRIMVDKIEGIMLYCHYLHFSMSSNQTIWGFINTYELERHPTLFD